MLWIDEFSCREIFHEKYVKFNRFCLTMLENHVNFPHFLTCRKNSCFEIEPSIPRAFTVHTSKCTVADSDKLFSSMDGVQGPFFAKARALKTAEQGNREQRSVLGVPAMKARSPVTFAASTRRFTGTGCKAEQHKRQRAVAPWYTRRWSTSCVHASGHRTQGIIVIFATKRAWKFSTF